jgi:hypothetical protein
MKTRVVQDNQPEPRLGSDGNEAVGYKHPTNLTGRIGRWSATHRKTAVLGWFAFVIAAFFVGSSVIGAKQATEYTGQGESGARSRSSTRASSNRPRRPCSSRATRYRHMPRPLSPPRARSSERCSAKTT